MVSDLNTYGRSERQAGLYEKIACALYHVIRQVEGISCEYVPETVTDCDSSAQTSPKPVTVVCIADTLGRQLTSLPRGDILLHAGNLSRYGSFAEIQAQLHWLNEQPHKHKVVIARSRDLLMDKDFVRNNPHLELGKHRTALKCGNVLYIHNSTTDLELPEHGRRIRIYGAAYNLQSQDPDYRDNRAFQYGPNKMNGDKGFWQDVIPENVDIALIHGPPKTHVDGGGNGCERLLEELRRVKPKAVVCGHVHEGRGQETLKWDAPQTWFEGVALRELNPWLCAAKMLLFLLCLVVRLLLGIEPKRESRRTTQVVNASVACGRRNVEKRDAITVVI
ncbi:hypothetical protein B0J13DRAFT_635163 [Dactylonectria estremocensis]|uniref:Calcineurin-like phosphoesterase domain-containing protein n=1 Tax=Dactylonectria estremocensis TaxID=1079267 RepID=A0A9P9EPY9_9HYPO|nr:hypothetical protein B0J13DRAFT_635163 [Dactylonectria estremocensis]